MPATSRHRRRSWFRPTNLVPFANTSGAPAVTQNSPIQNESANYLDIGVKQQAFTHLTVGVDGYYKFANNLLDEGQFGAPIILTPFNYKIGINKGVELTTDYNVGNFTFYGNLSIANQLAKGIESAQFNFSPSDLLSADGGFVNTDHSQLKTASAGVAYLWHGTRFTADMVAGSGLRSQPANDLEFNGETVPSYQQVNLGISHVFPVSFGGPVTVRLAIINLLDKIYLLRSQDRCRRILEPIRAAALGLCRPQEGVLSGRGLQGSASGPARARRNSVRSPRYSPGLYAALPAVESCRPDPAEPSAEAHP